MQRTFRRWALTGCCGLGLLAAAPATADAAGSVTTLPANFVTTTSVTLHGAIDPGGQTTSWEFQYGTTPSYQASTLIQTIPPGQNQTIYEAATLLQLHPNTTYHFRLLAFFSSQVGPNYEEAKAGQDLTVTTKPTGRLGLRNSSLPVSGGLVSAALRCRSQQACRGRFSITAQGKKRASLTCTSRHFSIRPGASQKVMGAVSAACRSLLARRPNHVLRAHFSAQTRTGQTGVSRTITLIG